MSILKREDFAYQDQYNNAICTAELLAETYDLNGLNERILC
jgi:hypothetical protein